MRPDVYLWHTQGFALSGIFSWLYRLRHVMPGELGVNVRLVDLALEPYDARQLADRPESFFDVRATNVPEFLEFLERTRDAVHVVNYGYHCLTVVELLAPQLVGRLKLAGMCHTHQDYYYANIRRFARHLRAMVAVSEECAATLRGIFPGDDRIAVLPANAVPVPPLRDPPPAASDAPLRLLYAGRVEQAQKRVGDLVEVARELGRLGSRASLSIVGDGRDREGLERFAAARRGVIPIAFHAARPPWEMDATYRAHDVFLLVSEFEGASVSVSEAMLHGLVPVVTRTPSGDPVLVDGRNCRMAGVGDAAALARHVHALELDGGERARLAAAARSDAVAYQEGLRYADRFERLVRALDAGAPPSAALGDLPRRNL